MPPGNMVAEKNFNADTLIQGGVIIGGVASIGEALTEQQRLDYGELLYQHLHKQQPDLPLTSTQVVRKALSRNLYSQMLDSYRFHGTGSAAFINIMQQRIPQRRYVLYTQIDNDAVQNNLIQHPATDEQEATVELQTVRSLSVNWLLYDLLDRQTIVWGMSTQAKATNQRWFYNRYTEEQLSPYYPDSPLLELVLTKAFDKLAAALPQREKE